MSTSSLASIITKNKRNGGGGSGEANDRPPTPISGSNAHSGSGDDIERELEQTVNKKAGSTEDRFRILDARDKLVRFRNPRVKVRVEEAAKLTGTCPDMCPEKERYMREVQRRLNPYECRTDQESEVDHCLAVKEYSRSSADQEEPLPHELRPISVLHKTFDYLLHNIIPGVEDETENLENWYFFLWDRIRGIRKDITQQQLGDLDAVCLMEKCARFHIVCSSLLCEQDRHAFDPKLNAENLMKCLQSLEHMYTDLTLKGIRCPNEPEFRAYQILMNLNEGDALWEIQQRPRWILKSPEVALALKMYMAVCYNNSMGFFRLVQGSSFLMSCILHGYFFQVRSRAIRAIIKAHTRPFKEVISMPTAIVKNILGYGSSDQGSLSFAEFCSLFGIEVNKTEECLEIHRSNRRVPEAPIMMKDYDLIESKLVTSVSEVINGKPLGPNPLDTYEPFTSFDQDGFLKGDILKSLSKTSNKNTISATIMPTTTVDTIDWEPRPTSPSDNGFSTSSSSSSSATKSTLFRNTFQKVNSSAAGTVNSRAPFGLFTKSSSTSSTLTSQSHPSFTNSPVAPRPSLFIKPSGFSTVSSVTTTTQSAPYTPDNVFKQSFGISTPSPTSSTMDQAKPIFGRLGPTPTTTEQTSLEPKPNLFNSSTPFRLPSQKSSAPGLGAFGSSASLNTFTAPSSGVSSLNTFGAGSHNVSAFGVKATPETTSSSSSGLPTTNIFATSQSQPQQTLQTRQLPSSAQMDPRRKRKGFSDDSEDQTSKRPDIQRQMFSVPPLSSNLSFTPVNFAPKPISVPNASTTPSPTWLPGTNAQVSNSLIQKIEEDVVKDLTKIIATSELKRHKQLAATAHDIANSVLHSVIQEQVQIIARQSSLARKIQIETALSQASKTIQRLRIRTLFDNWRQTVKEKQRERIIRLQKQKENLESFPPIVAIQLSPATILSTWCGFRASIPLRSSTSRPGSSKSFSLGSNGSSGSENSISTNEAEHEEAYGSLSQGSVNEELQDFPPIVSMQLSPETILSSWCGIDQQNQRKRTRSPDQANGQMNSNTPKRASLSHDNDKTQNLNSNTNSQLSFLQEIRDLLNKVREEKDLTISRLLSDEES